MKRIISLALALPMLAGLADHAALAGVRSTPTVRVVGGNDERVEDRLDAVSQEGHERSCPAPASLEAGDDAEPLDEVKQNCIDTYGDCILERWEGPCASCLAKCIAQRSWPSDRCYKRVKCPKGGTC
jgi:hypothetical protein